MRNVDRDRIKVRIASFVRTVPVQDEEGRYTGQNMPEYTEPVTIWATVSAGKGAATGGLFGWSADYDRQVTLDDPTLKVSEQDVVWIWTDPDADEPYDHLITSVARSAGYTVLGVKRAGASS